MLNISDEKMNSKQKYGRLFEVLKKCGSLRTKALRLNLLPITVVTSLLLAVSCSSIDCPMNSLVYTQYQLLDAVGRVDTLRDTLTISTTRTDGNDSVLINKDVNITSFSLPISYSQEQDIFYFELKDSLGNMPLIDTVRVTKENLPHFESADCPPSFFHKITGVSSTNNAIDSIVVNYPDVNYDTSKKHFNIYFKHRN